MRKIILPLVAALAFAAPATAQLSCIGDPPLRSEKGPLRVRGYELTTEEFDVWLSQIRSACTWGALADPLPQYMTPAEASAAYSGIGACPSGQAVVTLNAGTAPTCAPVESGGGAPDPHGDTHNPDDDPVTPYALQTAFLATPCTPGEIIQHSGKAKICNTAGSAWIVFAPITIGTDTDGNYANSESEGGPAADLNCTDCVSLGDETTGNYALGDAEGGAATTGDSATSFFPSGTLEDARLSANVSLLGQSIAAAEMADADHGDVSWSGGVATVDADSVALGTDTTGGYAASVSEGGAASDVACTTCIAAGEIAADAVTEATLKAVDSPTDEECVTYESTTGDFEYQSCGAVVPGSDTQVIYNDGGAFGADSGLVFNETTDRLTAAGGVSGPVGSSSTTTFNFGTAGTGAFSRDSSNFTVAIAGTVTAEVRQSVICGTARASAFDSGAVWGCLGGSGSATTPTIMPSGVFDNTTGMGLGGTTDGRLIAGSSSVLGFKRVSSVNTVTIYGMLTLTPQASAPATCSVGDIYSDTSGAYCGCSATNTWEAFNATGSCV